MASDNLLPCPFCGAALTDVQIADDGSGDIVWAVHPDKRGCWMDGYEFDWSAEGAYKPWNTRSPTGLTEWVPVSERLPRMGQVVWAHWSHGEVGPAKYAGSWGWHHPDNDEDDYRAPEHWQPFITPAPPESAVADAAKKVKP